MRTTKTRQLHAQASLPFVLLVFSHPCLAGQDSWSLIPDPVETIDYYLELQSTRDHLFAIPIDLNRDTQVFVRGHETDSEWEEIPVEGNPIAISVSGGQDEHVVVSTREKKLWYSGDTGASWSDRSVGLPAEGVINKVLVDESGWTFATIWKATGNTHGVARSSDFGETWEFVVWCSGCIYNPFQQLEFNGDPRYLWTGNIDGWLCAEMNRSTDWGETWEMVNVPPLYGEFPIDVVIDPVFPYRSYMLFPEPFDRYDGLDYIGFTLPPFGSNANMSLAAPSWDPGVLYASGLWTSGLVTIARSGDFGYDSWETVREGIPQEYPPRPYRNYWKNHLEPHPVEPRMYLAVFGMGLFERDFTLGPSSVTPDPRVGTEPGPMTLHPVTPNPTDGPVHITYDLFQGSLVQLEIIDAGGRVHFRSEEIWRNAGRHSFDGSVSAALERLPAGTYFLRLSSEHSQSTQQLSVLR